MREKRADGTFTLRRLARGRVSSSLPGFLKGCLDLARSALTFSAVRLNRGISKGLRIDLPLPCPSSMSDTWISALFSAKIRKNPCSRTTYVSGGLSA